MAASDHALAVVATLQMPVKMAVPIAIVMQIVFLLAVLLSSTAFVLVASMVQAMAFPMAAYPEIFALRVLTIATVWPLASLLVLVNSHAYVRQVSPVLVLDRRVVKHRAKAHALRQPSALLQERVPAVLQHQAFGRLEVWVQL